MKITLKLASYKSLSPFEIELPEFTVLVGVNGAGKSQLLIGLSKGIVKTKIGEVTLVGHTSTIKHISPQALNPNDEKPITGFEVNHKAIGLYNVLQSSKRDLERRPSNVFTRLPAKDVKILESVSNITGKEIKDLSRQDLIDNYPIFENSRNEIFNHDFHIIFRRYHDRWEENRYARFRNSELKDLNSKFYTDEEFIKKFKESPWNFVNKILAASNLEYRIKSPEGLHRDEAFEVKLINKENQEISFNDLSSGEKVIMSMALALYNFDHDMELPLVLLLDEPDASLHPSMTKQFLDVLERVFVKEKGIKVIITTHSPTTVALSPEDSLYVMNKQHPRIEKISKDKALAILTAGVPSLSVNYENRRQIFTEGHFDAMFYEKVYEKVKSKLLSDVSLNFISSGNGGSGSYDQVKEIVNKLKGFGNKSIFGIIDWDRKNVGNSHIKVLGENKRYSMEHYVFDPVFVGSLLLRDKIVTREEFGLLENESHSDLKRLTNEQLQRISDVVIERLVPYTDNMSTVTHTTEVQYCNGREIKVFSWYLTYPGHGELEKLLLKAFPPFSGYRGKLKQEMIESIIDDIPELIPMDVIDIIESIQKYGLEV